MSTRERTLLALAVAGFVVPNAMVIAYIADHGLDIGSYFSHWSESLPAAQLVADLGIAGLAFALWAAWEGRRLGMNSWWAPIPASLLVGVCFAVPLFLFLRERRVSSGAAAPPSPARGSSPGEPGRGPSG